MKNKNRITKRYLFPVVVSIVIFLTSIQLFSVEITNPPITEDFNAPTNVKNILKRACYDCHSNETNLRWYDKISPINWKVAQHVKDGRAGLNFSNWDKLGPSAQKAKLWEVINQIAAGAMPIKSYQIVHSSSKISASDLSILKNYLASMVNEKIADTVLINTAERQLTNWKINKEDHNQLPVSANGITYIPDYKNWQPISTTERFDNGTMRIIFGNAIALKAVKNKNINPWPNGTIFAKVAWKQIEDKDGNVRTGEFIQVEYMIKDTDKYKSTKGWGFARFKTTKLVPYGKTAIVALECLNCHKPMADNDFVFTQPLKH